jgi:hypothetical protein
MINFFIENLTGYFMLLKSFGKYFMNYYLLNSLNALIKKLREYRMKK